MSVNDTGGIKRQRYNMLMPLRNHHASDLPSRAVLMSIALFWTGWIVLMSARAAVIGFSEPGDLLLRRLVAASAGAILTFLFWRGLRLVQSDAPVRMVIIALTGAIPATAVFACANWFVFYGWQPPGTLATDVERWGYWPVFRYAVADTSVSWFFFFAGWAILYLFLSAAARLTAAEAASTQAQLRALRYQINPHFLFNALNALSDLVQSGRTDDADRMILDLSGLLRRMLNDADLPSSVSVAQEVELQRLYLALEARRFEDRLRIEIHIPEEHADFQVPRLILQPLVENAVKYSLGASRAVVTIRISAVSEAQMLRLSVDDDGCGVDDVRQGFGIGLSNVRDRLATIYGTAANLTAGRCEGGGYRASISIPRG